MLRYKLKQPIFYDFEKNIFQIYECNRTFKEVELKTPALFGYIYGLMDIVKYKGVCYNLTYISDRENTLGYIFINGNLAIVHTPNLIRKSKAVVEHNKNYSTFVDYFIKNLLKYKYSYGEPEIMEVDTLKKTAILINVPVIWEKTKKLKTRRPQPTTTSNSAQS